MERKGIGAGESQPMDILFQRESTASSFFGLRTKNYDRHTAKWLVGLLLGAISPARPLSNTCKSILVFWNMRGGSFYCFLSLLPK
jgi:hypothetical protein